MDRERGWRRSGRRARWTTLGFRAELGLSRERCHGKRKLREFPFQHSYYSKADRSDLSRSMS